MMASYDESREGCSYTYRPDPNGPEWYREVTVIGHRQKLREQLTPASDPYAGLPDLMAMRSPFRESTAAIRARHEVANAYTAARYARLREEGRTAPPQQPLPSTEGQVHVGGGSRGGAVAFAVSIAEDRLLDGSTGRRVRLEAQHADLSPSEQRDRALLLDLLSLTEARMRDLTGRRPGRGINNRGRLHQVRESLIAQLAGEAPISAAVRRIASEL